VRATVEALLTRVNARDDSDFLVECLEHRRRALEKQDKHAVETTRAIHPQYLAETIAHHAKRDAVFTADGGSPMVWCLRHIPSTGHNRTIVSLTHGTMANAMPQALGAQAAYPDRQVVSLSGDGGIAMMLGDLITAVQEKLPIKVCIVNNGTLGFVELEQKVEGMIEAFTELKNPDFARLAETIGFWSRRIEKSADLDAAVQQWLAAPGPALLDVVTDRFELVMPPKIDASQVFGTALYSVKAILAGKGRDVVGLMENALT